MRVTGFGPLFDEGAYEQDGHIRIDFGTDTPFLEEDAELDSVGARHVEENVRQLVELTGGGRKGLRRDGAAAVERAGREPCAAAGGAAGNEELSRALHDRTNPDAGAGGGSAAAGGAGGVPGGAASGRTCSIAAICRSGWASNIQQEANGYTYSSMRSARTRSTRFTPRKKCSSRTTTFSCTTSQIELYGQDGKPVDRIAGDEFEYDQKSGMATAQGPVEMMLTRPAARDRQWRKKHQRRSSLPPRSRRAGQIHVKTSGVTFDRNSGVVTTDAARGFLHGAGNGSAMGASTTRRAAT